MNKLPIWLAVSALLLIVGVILYALLGFNHAVEKPQQKNFDVRYGVVAELNEQEDDIQEVCDTAFKAVGISYDSYVTVQEVDGNPASATGDKVLRFVFSASVEDAKLDAAKTLVENALSAATFDGIMPFVSFHTLENKTFGDMAWRGAIALAVGAICALVYVGFRFGWASALTGLTLSLHDALVTAAIFAITRIPVFNFGPLLFASIAMVFSVILWLVRAIKLREINKAEETANLSAKEAVALSCKECKWWNVVLLVALSAVLVVFAVIATAGMRVYLFPALFAVAVVAYSAFLLGPAINVPVKAFFDKFNRSKKPRYFGKKKAEKTEENN